MKILAIDLGTNTGYCTNASGTVLSGTWKLATAKEVTAWGKTRLTRRGDPRVCRLAEHIQNVGKVDLIVFEDVEFSSFTKQTQLWSSLRAAIWIANCPDCGLLTEAVPVATLKKFATGNGGADKSMMLAALVRRFPEFIDLGRTPDDNEVDAIWIYLWATQTFSRKYPASIKI